MSNQPAYYTPHRVRFEYRKSRVAGAVCGTIYAVIYLKGQQSEMLSTGIRCDLIDWQSRTAPFRGQSAKELNEKLVFWEQALMKAARTLLDQGDPLTAGTILDEMNHVNQPLLTLEQVYILFEKFKSGQIGHHDATKRTFGQISRDTFRTYPNRWKWVSRYLKAKRKENILALKVDAPFVGAYHSWLIQQGPIGASYATKCVKILTKVCQWAFSQGHIRELRTSGFRGTNVPESVPYNLTENDICRLEALELTPDQARIRDAFLLARELCLHYSDYRSLKARHFSTDSKGRFIFERHRTKQESGRNIKMISFVSDRAKAVWLRYDEKISAPFTNEHLGRVIAEIGERLSLERRLKFSHARDSGIFRLLTLGRPEIEVKMAAGWTSMRQLTRYVNHDRKLLEELVVAPTPTLDRPAADRSNPFVHIHRAS